MSQLSLFDPLGNWGAVNFNVEFTKKLYEEDAEAKARERFNAAKKLKQDSLKRYLQRASEIDPAEEFRKMEFELLKNPKTYLPLESMESLCNNHEAVRKESSERVLHLMGLDDNDTESIFSIDPIYDCLVEDPNLLTWLKFAKLGIMEDGENDINIDWIEDTGSDIEVLSFESLWADWSSSWGSGWALECSTVSNYAWDNWDDWCEVKVRIDAFFERRMKKAEKRRFNRERFYLDWLFGERKSRGRSEKDSSSSDGDSLVGFGAHRPKSQRVKEAFYAPLKWLQPKLEKLKAKSLRSSLFQRSAGKSPSEELKPGSLKAVNGWFTSDELSSELGGLDSGEVGLTPELGPCEPGYSVKCW